MANNNRFSRILLRGGTKQELKKIGNGELESKLIKKEKLLDGLYKFSVEAKEIVDIAKPGNFVEIKVNENLDPFLRRPIKSFKTFKFWLSMIGAPNSPIVVLSVTTGTY